MNWVQIKEKADSDLSVLEKRYLLMKALIIVTKLKIKLRVLFDNVSNFFQRNRKLKLFLRNFGIQYIYRILKNRGLVR